MGLLPSAGKPWWQQATAVVSLSAGGAVTGFSFAPKASVDITSPASLPISLLALGHTVRQGQQATADDSALRSAIVKVANYYLQMAKDKTPAEMEAIIWQRDSLDGADHGPSCAAFASMTLELAAQVVGGQSWVTGGSSYPWPMHSWADVRVDPNPASPGVTSLLQDAEAHQRWHSLGDGYRPMPGDWVLFDQHVEVVTGDAGGVLRTVGGDSLPNFSVNAHVYPGPLAAQGVAGFVNNGVLAAAGSGGAPPARQAGTAQPSGPGPARAGQPAGASTQGSAVRLADIPGSPGHLPAETAQASPPGTAAIPGTRVPAPRPAHDATLAPVRAAPAEDAHPHSLARIPGVQAAPQPGTAVPQAPYRRHQPEPAVPAANGSPTRQAFISAVAPGAIAAQRKYGVPAAVTIAQAIEESGWGQSSLAVKDNNLFGIKGTGPAGTDQLPTQEYQDGQWVSLTAPFRVYHTAAQSIDDHGKLLATSGYYTRAMGVRRSPNAFAAALTGVYATDPSYGETLIGLMRQYNLYRYDAGVASSPAVAAAPAAPAGLSALAAQIPGAAWSGSATGRNAPATAPAHPAAAPHAIAGPDPIARVHATTTPPAPQATLTPAAPDPTVTPAAPPAVTPAAPPATVTPAAPQATVTPAAPQATVTPAAPQASATPAAPGPSATPAGPQPTGTAVAPQATVTPTGPTGTPAAASSAPPADAAGPAVTPPAAGQPGPTSPAGQATGSPSAGQATAPSTPAGRGGAAPGGYAPSQAAIPGIAGLAPAGRASGIPVQAATRADWIAGAAAEMAGRAAHPGGSIELTIVQMPLSPPASGTAATQAPAPGPAAGHRAISRATEERLADLQAGAERTARARSASAGPTSSPGASSRAVSPRTAGGRPPSARPAVSRAVEDRLADLQQPRAPHAWARPSGVPQTTGARTAAARQTPARPATQGTRAAQAGAPGAGTRGTRARAATARLYQPEIPPSARNAFITTAKGPLIRDELLYRDVANQAGISWKLLAACDWMQCQARPGYSAVHGEKVGTVNPDGSVYLTRSAGLGQCADDLLRLADSVYGIDLTARVCLSIADLANVFAAFRWGRLLVTHHTSAMEFPYSVAGLTTQHLHMRWPGIPDAPAPDKPGGRFRRPFGAVPIVLGLHYPATA